MIMHILNQFSKQTNIYVLMIKSLELKFFKMKHLHMYMLLSNLLYAPRADSIYQKKNCVLYSELTHWGQYQMVAILQTTVSNAFC